MDPLLPYMSRHQTTPRKPCAKSVNLQHSVNTEFAPLYMLVKSVDLMQVSPAASELSQPAAVPAAAAAAVQQAQAAVATPSPAPVSAPAPVVAPSPAASFAASAPVAESPSAPSAPTVPPMPQAPPAQVRACCQSVHATLCRCIYKGAGSCLVHICWQVFLQGHLPSCLQPRLMYS